MKIGIDKFMQNEVIFRTEYGKGKGKWGASERPPYGETDVEFEIEDELVWGNNVVLADGDAAMAISNQQVLFQGILESVDGDNCAVLRMKDSILLFVAKGQAFPVGSTIRIAAKDVTLYPCE